MIKTYWTSRIWQVPHSLNNDQKAALQCLLPHPLDGDPRALPLLPTPRTQPFTQQFIILTQPPKPFSQALAQALPLGTQNFTYDVSSFVRWKGTQIKDVANGPENYSTGTNPNDPPIVSPDAPTPPPNVPSPQSPPPDTYLTR